MTITQCALFAVVTIATAPLLFGSGERHASASAGAASCQTEIELTITSSSCPAPGPADLVAQGGSGGRLVFLFSIHGVGETVVPDGLTCAGTELGLEPKVFVAGFAVGDPAVLHLPRVPSNACGNIALQVLDLSTCATSNVVVFN